MDRTYHNTRAQQFRFLLLLAALSWVPIILLVWSLV